MNESKMRTLISDRVDRIKELTSKNTTKTGIGVIDWFFVELSTTLNGFALLNGDPPSGIGGSGRVDISRSPQAGIKLSKLMVKAFINVKKELSLDDVKTEYLIDNFIFHEIIHRAQNMGEGNHRGRQHYSNVLSHLDIEADSGAVLIQIELYLIETKRQKGSNTQDWKMYMAYVESVLHQTFMFMLCDDNKTFTKNENANRTLLVGQWERVLIWHFQFHRIEYFVRESRKRFLPITQFQILYRPAAAFRNQFIASRSKKLDVNWPSTERNILDNQNTNDISQNDSDLIRTNCNNQLEAVCVSPFNEWGIREPFYYNGSLDSYRALFKGVFMCDTSRNAGTGAFFNGWFETQPRLTGIRGDNDNGNDGGFPPPPNNGPNSNGPTSGIQAGTFDVQVGSEQRMIFEQPGTYYPAIALYNAFLMLSEDDKKEIIQKIQNAQVQFR